MTDKIDEIFMACFEGKLPDLELVADAKEVVVDGVDKWAFFKETLVHKETKEAVVTRQLEPPLVVDTGCLWKSGLLTGRIPEAERLALL